MSELNVMGYVIYLFDRTGNTVDWAFGANLMSEVSLYYAAEDAMYEFTDRLGYLPTTIKERGLGFSAAYRVFFTTIPRRNSDEKTNP